MQRGVSASLWDASSQAHARSELLRVLQRREKYIRPRREACNIHSGQRLTDETTVMCVLRSRAERICVGRKNPEMALLVVSSRIQTYQGRP
jgi:hypothetical protein